MTAQSRSNRYAWRRRTRRLMSFINALLAMAMAAVLVLPGVASAAPRCPGSGEPDGRGRCAYQLRRETCAWPARIVRIGSVAYCWRPAPEVQP